MTKHTKKVAFDFVLALSCLFAVLASNDAYGASAAESGESYFLSDFRLQAAEVLLEHGVDFELVEQLLSADLSEEQRAAVLGLVEELGVGLIDLEEALLSTLVVGPAWGCPPGRICLMLSIGVMLY